jgi:hypothetical protein
VFDAFQFAAALLWHKEQPPRGLFVGCDVRLAEAATKSVLTRCHNARLLGLSASSEFTTAGFEVLPYWHE